MRRTFEDLRVTLTNHIEQREDLTLVLHMAARYDVVYPLKYLDALEQASQRDIFLVHAQECFAAAEYFDGLMAGAEMGIDVGNRAIASGVADEGTTPWAGLPSPCFDPALRPEARLRALVEHVRLHYPDASHRIVVALLPSELHDAEGYAAMVRDLIPRDGYEPWMAGLRIIVRDSQEAPQLVPWIESEGVRGAAVVPIDFSAAAMASSLERDASDRTLPPDDRIAALVQMAGLDHAWGRIDDALKKYGLAYGYYVQTRNSAMQGLCLLCAGYALERAGRIPDAWQRYRQALELALVDEIRQLMLNAMMALASLHQRSGQWSEAATYWEGASFTAKSLNNGFAQADTMESWGVCLVALNDVDKALEIWELGDAVAQKWEYWLRAVSLLEHLVEIERREGRGDARLRHERELERARQELRVFEHRNPSPAVGGVS